MWDLDGYDNFTGIVKSIVIWFRVYEMTFQHIGYDAACLVGF